MAQMLEVGKQVGTGKVFISVPTEAYDTAKKPLTGERVHIVVFDPSEVPWLIDALRKELGAACRECGRPCPDDGTGICEDCLGG